MNECTEKARSVNGGREPGKASPTPDLQAEGRLPQELVLSLKQAYDPQGLGPKSSLPSIVWHLSQVRTDSFYNL